MGECTTFYRQHFLICSWYNALVHAKISIIPLSVGSTRLRLAFHLKLPKFANQNFPGSLKVVAVNSSDHVN